MKLKQIEAERDDLAN
jgi:hypothetical protein